LELNLNSRALEKLIDHVASGIGSGAGYVLAPLAPWRAGQEAEARRIMASGEADAVRTIAEAQTEAKEIMASPDSR
jgi:regulator of protease activity HflC (stomatin/prohibitin superfamily)